MEEQHGATRPTLLDMEVSAIAGVHHMGLRTGEAELAISVGVRPGGQLEQHP